MPYFPFHIASPLGRRPLPYRCPEYKCARQTEVKRRDYELNIELLYKLQLTSWLSMKPNLQYIITPSGGGPIDDVLVGTLRIELTWN